MEVTEAVAVLERMFHRKMTLANAPRGEWSKAVGEQHRKEAAAIATVLANLLEGAKR